MLSDEYQTLEGTADAIIEDRGSRFIATAAPVDTPEKAGDLVGRISLDHPDALDCFFVYKIGLEPNPIFHISDGEGGGGKMMGDLLQASGITNAIFIVIREAGDANPLSPSDQAYRDAARNALRRAKIVTRIQYDTLRFLVPRDDLEFVSRLIIDNRGKIIQTLNGPLLVVSVKVRQAQADDMKKNLADASHGRVKPAE